MEERTSRMMEEEKAQDKAFLEFHDRQSDLNRQHELHMMEMIMQFSRYQQALHSQHVTHGGAHLANSYKFCNRNYVLLKTILLLNVSPFSTILGCNLEFLYLWKLL